MDRPLDEMIVERQGRSRGGNRRGRRDQGPRDGVRKPAPRSRSRDLNSNWLHDRFEEDPQPRRRNDGDRDRRTDRYEPGREDGMPGKLRIENLHYDLTDRDLRGLFERIGPVEHVEILYDKQDRSRGVAYVTYTDARDAPDAIKEFDGANAMGQPIRVSVVPIGPRGRGRNAFDTIDGPKPRSLFERIDDPTARGRHRSASPRDRKGRDIDRYVPGERRSRSPPPRNRRGGGISALGGRRPGQQREDSGRRNERRRGAKDGEGRSTGARPRKTVDELDAEMDDYFSPADGVTSVDSAPAVAPGGLDPASNQPVDDDDMMVE